MELGVGVHERVEHPRGVLEPQARVPQHERLVEVAGGEVVPEQGLVLVVRIVRAADGPRTKRLRGQVPIELLVPEVDIFEVEQEVLDVVGVRVANDGAQVEVEPTHLLHGKVLDERDVLVEERRLLERVEVVVVLLELLGHAADEGLFVAAEGEKAVARRGLDERLVALGREGRVEGAEFARVLEGVERHGCAWVKK